MKLICLAGQDEIKDISKIKRKIKARKIAEHQTYLWDKYKALIELNKKPAVDYVLRAINDAATVDKAVLVGSGLEDRIKKTKSHKIEFVQQGKSYGENLKKGYQKLNPEKDEYVLVIAGDLPLLTGKIIDKANRFYEKKLTADFVVGVVGEDVLKNYLRKYVRAYDDLFGKGRRDMKEANFYYINGNVDFDRIEKLFGVRKMMEYRNRVKLAGFIIDSEKLYTLALIPNLLCQWISSGVKLSYAEKHLGKLLGCKVKFIESVFPEFSMDLDSEEDLKIIESTMKKR